MNITKNRGLLVVELVLALTVSVSLPGFVLADDAPAQLTIITQVVNDDGGNAVPSDFRMNVTATNPSNNAFPGSDTGVTITLDPGTYSVFEIQLVGGYSQDFFGDCGTGTEPITISAGEHKTCTVVNNDLQSEIYVVNHVINDNGGTAVAGDFTMNVTGSNVNLVSFPGQEAFGTLIELDANAPYFVSETGPTGYTTTYSADCSSTLVTGEVRICTVTNDDIVTTPTEKGQCKNDGWMTFNSPSFKNRGQCVSFVNHGARDRSR